MAGLVYDICIVKTQTKKKQCSIIFKNIFNFTPLNQNITHI